MNRITMVMSAATVLLALGGCSGAGGGSGGTSAPSEAGGPPGAPGAPASSAPSSAAPTEMAAPEGTPQPSGALSMVDACQAVLANQKAGLAALRTWLKNPVDPKVDAQDIDRLRSKLVTVELTAPDPLRQELRTQEEVLASLAQSMRAGRLRGGDVSAFEHASDRINNLCRPTGS